MPKDANWDPRIHMGKAWEVMIIEVRISYALKEGDIATYYLLQLETAGFVRIALSRPYVLNFQ
jgi:hypothetical protein